MIPGFSQCNFAPGSVFLQTFLMSHTEATLYCRLRHFSAGFYCLRRWVVTVILGLSNSISNNKWRRNDQLQSFTTEFKFNKTGFIFWRRDGYETRGAHKLNSIPSSIFAVVNKVGTVRLLFFYSRFAHFSLRMENYKCKSNVEQIWMLL